MNGRLWTIPVAFAVALSTVLPAGTPHPASISMADAFVASMGEYREGALLGKRGPTSRLPDFLRHPLNRLLHDERMAFDPLYREFQQACGDPWPAIPGLMGFGSTAMGAQTDSLIFGGNCIEDDGDEIAGALHRVTNTNGTGTGSFRDAVNSAQDDRVDAIVFETGGQISADSNVVVRNDGIYVLGQSVQAPGKIMLERNGITDDGTSETSDLVFSYMGIQRRQWFSMQFDFARRIVLDHLSIAYCGGSGGINCVSFQPDTSEAGGQHVREVSTQYTMIFYCDDDHATAYQSGIQPRPGSEYNNAEDVSRHSLFRNSLGWGCHRNPMAKLDWEIVQNVNYGWGFRSGEGGYCFRVDYIGNYQRAGPSSSAGDDHYEFAHSPNDGPCVTSSGAAPPLVHVSLERNGGQGTPYDSTESTDSILAGPNRTANCRATGGGSPCTSTGDPIPSGWRSSVRVVADTSDFPLPEAAVSDVLRDAVWEDSVSASYQVDSLGARIFERFDSDTLALGQARDSAQTDCGDVDGDFQCEAGEIGVETPPSGVAFRDSEPDGIPDAYEEARSSCFTVGTDDFFGNCDNDKWVNGIEFHYWTDPEVTNNADGSEGSGASATFGNGIFVRKYDDLDTTPRIFDLDLDGTPDTLAPRIWPNGVSLQPARFIISGDSVGLLSSQTDPGGGTLMDSAAVVDFCSSKPECSMDDLRDISITPGAGLIPHQPPKPEDPPEPTYAGRFWLRRA